MSPLRVSRRWIYRLLSANSALVALLATPISGRTFSIFTSSPPVGSPFPFVRYDRIQGVPFSLIQESTLAVASYLYLIKVVTDGPEEAPGQDIFESVQATLETVSATQDGYLVTCVMEDDYLFTEERDGRYYKHIGGYFRIRVRTTIS